jgi:transposase
MIIIGTDFHPEFQQIACVDTDTGELQERRLAHREEEEKFYRDLVTARQQVRVGMEASGHARLTPPTLSEMPDFVNDGFLPLICLDSLGQLD